MNATPADEKAITLRIASRFRGRWEPRYVRGKLAHDPLYRGALEVFAGTQLPLLDIGCGMGLLGMYLGEHGVAPEYLGLDSDARKIASARAICAEHFPRMRFIEGDAGSLPKFSGNVAIFDALHYMPAELQQQVLRQAAQRVAVGGALVIRNCLRDHSWRYWITVAEEKVLAWTRWMKVGAQHIPTAEEILEPLRESGLDVELAPLWGHTPYNSYRVIARRPQPNARRASIDLRGERASREHT